MTLGQEKVLLSRINLYNFFSNVLTGCCVAESWRHKKFNETGGLARTFAWTSLMIGIIGNGRTQQQKRDSM
jgi:hypothetical protein